MGRDYSLDEEDKAGMEPLMQPLRAARPFEALEHDELAKLLQSPSGPTERDAAVDEFMHRYPTDILRCVAVEMLDYSPADQQDVAIEAVERILFKVAKGKYTCGGGKRFPSWCMVVAKNYARTVCRKLRRDPVSSATAFDDLRTEYSTEDFEEANSRVTRTDPESEAKKRVWDAAKQGDRDLFLWQAAGYTDRVIGQLLGIDADRVANRRNKAKARLVKAFKAEIAKIHERREHRESAAGAEEARP